MKLKDLRKIIKGLKGNVDIDRGYIGYYPAWKDFDSININIDTGEILDEEIPEVVNKICFWIED